MYDDILFKSLSEIDPAAHALWLVNGCWGGLWRGLFEMIRIRLGRDGEAMAVHGFACVEC